LNGFTDHFNTRLGSRSDYSVTANLHNSQIITEPAKPFSNPLCLHQPFLATASNGGNSSASRAQVLSSQPPVQNSTESESYVTTDGQSASLSWNKAPIWGLRPDFNYCLTVAGFLIWGVLSDERTGMSFAFAVGPRQRNLGSEFLGTRDHTLRSQIRDFPFRRLLRLAGSRWRYSTPPPLN
jgi:hypothetical protein